MAGYKRIVLSGQSGTGKSTIARLLAQRLSWDVFDTDEAVVRASGSSIAQLFAREGEPAFRDRERAAVQEATSLDRTVVASGGGAPLDPQNAELLWRDAFVVALQASPETIVGRLKQSDESRPLLEDGDSLARIRAQHDERAAVYARAHSSVRTDGLSPEQVVDEIERALRLSDDPAIAFEVRTETARYPIVVGWDNLRELGERMRSVGLAGTSAFVVSDSAVLPLYGPRVHESLEAAGFRVASRAVPAGESSKTLDEAERLYDWLVSERAERSGVIVALGGGVVGDLAGFVAATYLRGMPFVQVPTTLLAMSDAAIGGKVAVDHREGKNLIGAFYQPRLVFEDVSLLRTLEPRELNAGWAEVIKHAMILDPDLLDLLEANADAIALLDPELAQQVVARNVTIKGRVVSEDEHEHGLRTVLNYGHTVAHAIEAATGYGEYLHGEAVAVGMVAAASISREMGLLSLKLEQRQNTLLQRFGLPVCAPGVDSQRILEAMALDKKVQDKTVRWVLLEDVGKPVLRSDVPMALVARIVASVTSGS